ncbi:acyl carrier protein [uncultured Corynebacterium sp.]|uniref:acyl carrier protein n=1 Tax=uncultured Corynebacterium sp. TaxID=159447 RepID=UPI0025DE71B9|nr:acyl carrier protein [uncultured Corynebacterium sp.]
MNSDRDRVIRLVSEVLYIDEEDLVDGDDTDLRELGLDSVRSAMLSDALGLTGRKGPMRRVYAAPTIRTLVEECGGR